MEPVIDRYTDILIVGSYPSEISLSSGQYYGNPRNHFWKLVGCVLDVDLVELDYDERLRILQEYQIGLWDTLKDCQRKGSLDSNIQNEIYNDLSGLTHIRRIICNGSMAGKYIRHCKVPAGVMIFTVPSSSSARVMKFSEKLEQWKKAMCD
jgi:TDG/mug DNA glycosylase family protein